MTLVFLTWTHASYCASSIYFDALYILSIHFTRDQLYTCKDTANSLIYACSTVDYVLVMSVNKV